jgi:peptidyl-prolyl cis-trans isomerase SurA
MSDGILATVNDSVITGFDLRQRMLLLIAMTQVQPTPENIPAIQQQALNLLVDERLQAQELTKYEDLVISDEEVDEELAAMAQEVGAAPATYVEFLAQGGIRPSTLREQLRTQLGWSQLVGGRFQSRARVSRAAIDAALRQASEAASKKQYLIGEIYIEASRVGGQQAALNGATSWCSRWSRARPSRPSPNNFRPPPRPPAAATPAGSWKAPCSRPCSRRWINSTSASCRAHPGRWRRLHCLYARQTRRRVGQPGPDQTGDDRTAGNRHRCGGGGRDARLEALRPQLTCDTMLARATSEQGLLGSDLGEADVQNLAPQFQQVARSAEVGSRQHAGPHAPRRAPAGRLRATGWRYRGA